MKLFQIDLKDLSPDDSLLIEKLVVVESVTAGKGDKPGKLTGKKYQLKRKRNGNFRAQKPETVTRTADELDLRYYNLLKDGEGAILTKA